MNRIRKHPRVLLSLIMALLMVGATVQTAEACFYGCIYHFGFVTVADGDVVYYNGCYSYIDDYGHTQVTCYYTSAVN